MRVGILLRWQQEWKNARARERERALFYLVLLSDFNQNRLAYGSSVLKQLKYFSNFVYTCLCLCFFQVLFLSRARPIFFYFFICAYYFKFDKLARICDTLVICFRLTTARKKKICTTVQLRVDFDKLWTFDDFRSWHGFCCFEEKKKKLFLIQKKKIVSGRGCGHGISTLSFNCFDFVIISSISLSLFKIYCFCLIILLFISIFLRQFNIQSINCSHQFFSVAFSTFLHCIYNIYWHIHVVVIFFFFFQYSGWFICFVL